jgi:hypothetical protein
MGVAVGFTKQFFQIGGIFTIRQAVGLQNDSRSLRPGSLTDTVLSDAYQYPQSQWYTFSLAKRF